MNSHQVIFQRKVDLYGIEHILEQKSYFQFASHFLHEHKFKNPHYKKIWELHSDGFSIRKIKLHVPYGSTNVFKIIKKLAKLLFTKLKEQFPCTQI